MSRHVALFVALTLTVGARCWAEPFEGTQPPIPGGSANVSGSWVGSASRNSPSETSVESRGEVQAAPGGGDMLMLGPEFRYVTRGSLDRQGRLRVGCAHDGGSGAAPAGAK